MRIIGGKKRGAKLIVPTTDDIRPTSDKVRQALFNILAYKMSINFQGAKIADICAGTGALGFEALSHGAKTCSFYDVASLPLIRRNAEKLKFDNIKFIQADAANLPKAPHFFDLVFLDPPYRKQWLEVILPQLISSHYIALHAYVVCEEDKREKIKIPPQFKVMDHRNYGNTQLLILKLVDL